MNRHTIRRQTLLIALLPMLLAVILLDTYFLYSRFNAMESSMVERAELLAKQIGAAGEYALFSGNIAQVQDDVDAAVKQKDVSIIAIQDASGNYLVYAGEALSDAESKAAQSYNHFGMVAESSSDLWVRDAIVTHTVELLDFEAAEEPPRSTILGYVLIKMNKSRLSKAKWEVLAVSLFISLLLVALTLYFVLRVSQNIVNPIKALNYVARSIGEGALDMRVSPAPDILELNELANGINEMAKQLQFDRNILEERTELLRTSQERLNEIINMMPVSLFIKDVDSRIILMNSACEAQWGVLFANIEGSKGEKYFPAEQMKKFINDDQLVFQNRRIINFEETVWNAEIRENRTVHTFKKPIYDAAGKPVYMIGISIDISERKLAEIRLKQLNEKLETRIEEATRALRQKKEDAENANYDKTRFLASASHDLRQPMHALGLFVGELHAKLTTPEQQHIVAKVEESVDALSNLLDALLDISKLDAGVVTPNFSVFSMAGMLERIAHDYAPLAQRKSITLRVRPDKTLVNSDPILLERIIINLLSNAIRYTPSGGRILIACRTRGNQLRIEVRDSGIGIPEDSQKSIFREFIQLANKERDRSKGLGLGLAIVERIVKLLNHSIELNSRPGQGSTFAVNVVKVESPKVEMSEQTVAAEKNIEQRLPSLFDDLKVLVIDDNQLVLNGTKGILESWGCVVCAVQSLGEVKALDRTSQFDLVVCDFRLADGDGIEIAEWIKVNFNTQPQFILISGDTSPDVLQRVKEQGIQLLHKPVRPAKLRSLIQFMIGQKNLKS
ncbi:MAG: ATP-binding protein [Gallionellaceae bacterium]|jgi:PAS domain S-box-containing protein